MCVCVCVCLCLCKQVCASIHGFIYEIFSMYYFFVGKAVNKKLQVNVPDEDGYESIFQHAISSFPVLLLKMNI